MRTMKTIIALGAIAAIGIAACADEEPSDQSSQNDGDPGGGQAPAPSGNAGGGAPNGSGGGGGQADCPHQGPPLIDPAQFVACPSYVCETGAHCVPNALVPPDVSDLLPSCNDELKCVPDLFIETLGNFLLEPCTSVLELEGRCISGCIPLVAESADYLEQGSCNAGELCAPCFDPLSGEPTGLCTLTCDAGPVEPAPAPAPSCCSQDEGTCVPGHLVPPDQQGSLSQDKCPDSGQLCVPTEMLDPLFSATPCEPDILLQMLGIDEGACLPACVDGVKNIGAGSCPSGYKCAPCDALGQSTGACGDDW